MEIDNRNLINSTKKLFIEFCKYSVEQINVDYIISLKDGSKFKGDLVINKKPLVPYLVVFMTSDSVSAEQVKTLLSQSSLQFGIVINKGNYPEFWGIVKKTNKFTGKLKFENIYDYSQLKNPRSVKLWHVMGAVIIGLLYKKTGLRMTILYAIFSVYLQMLALAYMVLTGTTNPNDPTTRAFPTYTSTPNPHRPQPPVKPTELLQSSRMGCGCLVDT